MKIIVLNYIIILTILNNSIYFLKMSTFITKEKGVLHLGVHGGKFHLDDVLCCYLISSLYGERCNNKVIIHRSINAGKDLDNCDFVMDVGMEYDHTKRHYDHHQKDFNETYNNRNIKLAASGLIWRHYGKEIVKTLISDMTDFKDKLTKHKIEIITDKIYDSMISFVDARDNGLNQYSELITLKPNYIDNSNLGYFVSLFNENWFEDLTPEQTLERFKQAMFIVGEYFMKIFKKSVYSIQAQKIINKAYNERFKYRFDGRVLVLENSSIPVNIFKLNLKADPKILYIVGFNKERKQYSALAVNETTENYKTILPFPKEWRGLPEEELIKISGIPDSTFVHSTGFLACNRTLKGILLMIDKSIKLNLHTIEKPNKNNKLCYINIINKYIISVIFMFIMFIFYYIYFYRQ